MRIVLFFLQPKVNYNVGEPRLSLALPVFRSSGRSPELLHE